MTLGEHLRIIAPVALSFFLSIPAGAQVDQKKVDEAIRTGAAWLTKKYERGFDASGWNSTLELVVLTLSHAGVKPEDPVFKSGFEALLSCKLQYTYRVAALAMALQRIDPVRHQDRIAHCAQWLVDTQLPEGEWGYPDTLTTVEQAPKAVEVDPPKIEKKAEAKPGSSVPAIRIKRNIHKTLNLKAKGDFSNTQFAILGLRACHDAGIEIPKATWQAALGYVLKTQNQDGGWGYYFNGMKDKESYASMTCAGVCSVAICGYGMGVKEPAKAPSARAGLAWLGPNYDPKENANAKMSHVADPLRWHYYYLYSIERVGRILQIEELGKKKWYETGAEYLLEKQKKDGGWFTEITNGMWKQAGDLETADTCFAILFLTRATPPLVATTDRK